jgi:hypothetical protein
MVFEMGMVKEKIITWVEKLLFDIVLSKNNGNNQTVQECNWILLKVLCIVNLQTVFKITAFEDPLFEFASSKWNSSVLIIPKQTLRCVALKCCFI